MSCVYHLFLEHSVYMYILKPLKTTVQRQGAWACVRGRWWQWDVSALSIQRNARNATTQRTVSISQFCPLRRLRASLPASVAWKSIYASALRCVPSVTCVWRKLGFKRGFLATQRLVMQRYIVQTIKISKFRYIVIVLISFQYRRNDVDVVYLFSFL